MIKHVFAVILTAAVAGPVAAQERVNGSDVSPAWAAIVGSSQDTTGQGLYRRAREYFNDAQYRQAVDAFRALREGYGSSRFAPMAMYYEAFALSRLDTEPSYREALDVLTRYRSAYGAAYTSDAEMLYTRIQGMLARLGDADAAAAVAARASQIEGQGIRGARIQDGVRVSGARSQSEDDDVRMQALNALMQMDAENAMPILRDVLANRDPDRANLRRRAVFLVAQKRADGREDILLDAARSDPDLEVRVEAVYWLSQVRTDRAVDALDSIIRFATEEPLQERAIFALSQHRSQRASEILRDYARRVDVSLALRAQAIQWMGQKRSGGPFLRELYAELDEGSLKERVLFALSQSRDEGSSEFLMDIALDEGESLFLRKRALFWAGQRRTLANRLYELYDQMTDREMKDQLIAAYGQRRRDSVAVDVLIGIAQTEPDTELRNRAIFWLGQTRHPRAAAFLRELINR